MKNINEETIIKNKKKLQAHLERYKHEDSFIVTNRKISYWFNVINRAMFDGKLPRPKFELKKMEDAWGMCWHTKKTGEIIIYLDTGIDSRDLFIATLAHELVHFWQQLNEGRQSHIKSYLRWKRIFKKKLNIDL